MKPILLVEINGSDEVDVDDSDIFDDPWTVSSYLTGGAGIAFRIGKKASIGIEHKIKSVMGRGDDLLDAAELLGSSETSSRDLINYTNIRLSFAIGGDDKSQPLFWASPLDMIADDLAEVKARPIFDNNDTDGDGVVDAFDQENNTDSGCAVDTRGVTLDSDNDGIPDAVEACGDITLTLEDCSLDSNGDAEYLDEDVDGCPDGLVASYCTDAPIDTDGDGTPDYLDLDSDGDGCADNIEAATDGFGTSEDTYLAGTVDGFGLLTSGVSGDCPIPTTTAYTDSTDTTACDEPTDPCELDGPDKDNDGVADGDDLDTDNDGIPDSVEFGCTEADTELFWDELADPLGSFDFDWLDIFDTGINMNLTSNYPEGLDINMTYRDLIIYYPRY